MNRIKQAWLALRGELQPEVVRGPPANVNDTTLYQVECSSYAIARVLDDDYSRSILWKFYPTCEAAFLATKGNRSLYVEAVDVIKVGDRYFKGTEVLLQPKPKIEKGREHADGAA